MLDAMIASALKRLLTHVYFRKRVSVEEQRAQKDDRFLRGRQTVYMICEQFRATGAYEAVKGLGHLFNFRVQNDDVQDFDTGWDQALLAASEIHHENGPGRFLTSQNYRTLFSFRLYWLCMNKRIFESTNNRGIPD